MFNVRDVLTNSMFNVRDVLINLMFNVTSCDSFVIPYVESASINSMFNVRDVLWSMLDKSSPCQRLWRPHQFNVQRSWRLVIHTWYHTSSRCPSSQCSTFVMSSCDQCVTCRVWREMESVSINTNVRYILSIFVVMMVANVYVNVWNRGVREGIKRGAGIVRTWDRPYSGGGCVRDWEWYEMVIIDRWTKATGDSGPFVCFCYCLYCACAMLCNFTKQFYFWTVEAVQPEKKQHMSVKTTFSRPSLTLPCPLGWCSLIVFPVSMSLGFPGRSRRVYGLG